MEPVPVEGAALPMCGTGADLGGSPASEFTDALSCPSRSSPGPLEPGAANTDHDACAAASSPSPAPALGPDGVAAAEGRGTLESPVRRLDEELVKVEVSEHGGGPPRLDQVLDRAREAFGSVQGMLRPVLGEQARLHAELARSRAALERSHSRPRPYRSTVERRGERCVKPSALREAYGCGPTCPPGCKLIHRSLAGGPATAPVCIRV